MDDVERHTLSRDLQPISRSGKRLLWQRPHGAARVSQIHETDTQGYIKLPWFTVRRRSKRRARLLSTLSRGVDILLHLRGIDQVHGQLDVGGRGLEHLLGGVVIAALGLVHTAVVRVIVHFHGARDGA